MADFSLNMSSLFPTHLDSGQAQHLKACYHRDIVFLLGFGFTKLLLSEASWLILRMRKRRWQNGTQFHSFSEDKQMMAEICWCDTKLLRKIHFKFHFRNHKRLLPMLAERWKISKRSEFVFLELQIKPFWVGSNSNEFARDYKKVGQVGLLQSRLLLDLSNLTVWVDNQSIGIAALQTADTAARVRKGTGYEFVNACCTWCVHPIAGIILKPWWPCLKCSLLNFIQLLDLLGTIPCGSWFILRAISRAITATIHHRVCPTGNSFFRLNIIFAPSASMRLFW